MNPFLNTQTIYRHFLVSKQQLHADKWTEEIKFYKEIEKSFPKSFNWYGCDKADIRKYTVIFMSLMDVDPNFISFFIPLAVI